jgi:hypothetical protein
LVVEKNSISFIWQNSFKMVRVIINRISHGFVNWQA